MVIDKDNKPHRRKIAVGIRDGGHGAGHRRPRERSARGHRSARFELFKLDDEVLGKTKVQIAPAKEEEEPEET